MANKNNKKTNGTNPFARILCLVLVGLMVVGGAVLTIVATIANSCAG